MPTRKPIMINLEIVSLPSAWFLLYRGATGSYQTNSFVYLAGSPCAGEGDQPIIWTLRRGATL